MILLGLFVGVLLSGPSHAQSRHDGSDPAVTVPELEDLAEQETERRDALIRQWRDESRRHAEQAKLR
jgi:hypothetical protein